MAPEKERKGKRGGGKLSSIVKVSSTLFTFTENPSFFVIKRTRKNDGPYFFPSYLIYELKKNIRIKNAVFITNIPK